MGDKLGDTSLHLPFWHADKEVRTKQWVISIEDAFLNLLLSNYGTKTGRLAIVILRQPAMDRPTVLQDRVSLQELSLLFARDWLTLILLNCLLTLRRFFRQRRTTLFFLVSSYFLPMYICLAIQSEYDTAKIILIILSLEDGFAFLIQRFGA